MVLTSGGVSMGELDLLQPLLERYGASSHSSKNNKRLIFYVTEKARFTLDGS